MTEKMIGEIEQRLALRCFIMYIGHVIHLVRKALDIALFIIKVMIATPLLTGTG